MLFNLGDAVADLLSHSSTNLTLNAIQV